MNYYDVIRKLVTGGAFTEEEKAEAILAVDAQEGDKPETAPEPAPIPTTYEPAKVPEATTTGNPTLEETAPVAPPEGV